MILYMCSAGRKILIDTLEDNEYCTLSGTPITLVLIRGLQIQLADASEF